MLNIKNLNKTFNQSTPDQTILFDNFNLDIQKGEFVSIIGSNGSGKSTLLNIICGTTNATYGELIFCGKNIENLAEFERAKFIGRVLQDPKLGTCPDLTVAENMSLAYNKGQKYNLNQAVKKDELELFKTLLAECNMGLENKLDTKIKLLSGGQRQAIALIIANMTDIDILILDEHTAALDPKSSEIIMEITNKLLSKKKITTLMVTHNLRHAVTYGTRLIMMHEGKKILDISGEDKKKLEIKDILDTFNEISIECGN